MNISGLKERRMHLVKNDDIWSFLESLNISKVFILYKGKCKEKELPSIKIDSVIVTTKCGKNEIKWDNELYNNKSFLTKPIYDLHIDFTGKIDGMLTYDNVKKKSTITGKHKYKITEKFNKEI